MSATRLGTAAWSAVLVGIVTSGNAEAAVSDAEFEQLRAQMTALIQRVSALEQENAELRENTARAVSELELTRAPDAAPSRPAGHWSDTIRLSGDFRYRYEEIDIEARDVRSRHRLRARAGLVAQLPNSVEVGLRIAAGNEAPPSGNTTLGSGGSSKDLFLDQAWVTWKPFNGAYLTGGKMKNNFYRPQGSGLLWDSDYTPEGIALGWSGNGVFLNAAAIGLESDSNRANHTFYYGVQSGFTLDLGEQLAFTAGAGYLDIPVQGKTVLYGDSDDFYGNSFACDSDGRCTYSNNFEELELFSDLTWSGMALPLAVYAHYVQNLDADEYDTGWLAGARLGKASGAGSWDLGYQYERVEADAVFGLLRDSNVAGGGADIRGHKLSGRYAIDKQWHMGVSVYVDNESGENALGAGRDLDRIVLDTIFKY
ncbi:putative porin [Haliea sp. E1-2-M8]|uniref:putative porin n=1 Tax=Haliea sp. E1-2-M8 TaxID=3064706 RepID=UPI00271FFA14|nr:putative porin [Haliea sp. E1-2-M8]MDO8863922.1 putative porin [Haliea sp. E1-2-M8]